MPKKNQSKQKTRDRADELMDRLEETEETMRAISQYMVDAFVVSRSNGTQVVTLGDADFPYRMMVESMNEGAITLIPDGTIFYSNPCFGLMVQIEPEKLVGMRFQDLLPAEQQGQFQSMLSEAGVGGQRGEFCLQAGSENCVPVQLSFYPLRQEGTNGIAIIATDISERKHAEARIRSLASELTIAEQEERHRISQVLHDDLQQRLFAIRAQLAFSLDELKENSLSSDTQVSIDQIQNWLTEAINITRNMSVDISPAVLQGEGLVEAIHWLASRMKEQHNLQIEVKATYDFASLPDHMRVTLFQAIRELLFNVVKHAGVLDATVTLDKLDGHGQIMISDSGEGFDTKTILADSQMAHGLLIIRNRLSLMGGTLDVDSEPGDGTRVKIGFPI